MKYIEEYELIYSFFLVDFKYRLSFLEIHLWTLNYRESLSKNKQNETSLFWYVQIFCCQDK